MSCPECKITVLIRMLLGVEPPAEQKAYLVLHDAAQKEGFWKYSWTRAATPATAAVEGLVPVRA